MLRLVSWELLDNHDSLSVASLDYEVEFGAFRVVERGSHSGSRVSAVRSVRVVHLTEQSLSISEQPMGEPDGLAAHAQRPSE